MRNLKCPKCKYEWNSKTELNSITCPNCQRKFQIKFDDMKGGLQHGNKTRNH